MTKKKINNFKMLDLVDNCNLTDSLFYKNIFSIKYPTILVIGASRSGKTELIRNILYHVMEPWRTKLFIAAPTCFKDKGYKKIISTMRGINELVIAPEPSVAFFEKLQNEQNTNKSDFATENVVIFDDISDQLKNNKAINHWCTKNRHENSLMIVSTQNYVDTNTKLRRQATHLILFGNLMQQDLELIYKNFVSSNFKMIIEDFYALYYEATKLKYHYLFIDVIEKKMRESIDIELEL